jgi:hypothetical protein
MPSMIGAAHSAPMLCAKDQPLFHRDQFNLTARLSKKSRIVDDGPSIAATFARSGLETPGAIG